MSQDSLSQTQFMTAKQLRGMRMQSVEAAIGQGRVGTKQGITKSIMAKKLREAKKSGLHEDIKKNGVKEPVHITTNPINNEHTLADGQHRVAAAMTIDPKMKIPVKYD